MNNKKFEIKIIQQRTEKKREEVFKVQIKNIVDRIVSRNKDVYSGQEKELFLIKKELEGIAGGAIRDGIITLNENGKMEKVLISGQSLSNLSVEDWLITKTKRFKKWFSGSKITDENEEPFIVYHGGACKIDEWKKEKISSSSNDEGFIGRGFYFGNKKYAQGYEKGFLGGYFINSQNPFIIDIFEADDKKTNSVFVDQFKQLSGVGDELVRRLEVASGNGYMLSGLVMKVIGSKKFTDILQKNGYDASCSQLKGGSKINSQKFKSSSKFKIKSVTNMAGRNRFIEITAFEPNQIKGRENLLFNPSSSKVYE